MVEFGEVPTEVDMFRLVMASPAALSKSGGPGATDVLLGTSKIPGILLDAPTGYKKGLF